MNWRQIELHLQIKMFVCERHAKIEKEVFTSVESEVKLPLALTSLSHYIFGINR